MVTTLSTSTIEPKWPAKNAKQLTACGGSDSWKAVGSVAVAIADDGEDEDEDEDEYEHGEGDEDGDKTDVTVNDLDSYSCHSISC